MLSRLPIVLWHLLLSAVVALFTFPSWQPFAAVSVDGSCAWLYDYLWEHDRAQLAHLVFPHGPLDFLLGQPLGDPLLEYAPDTATGMQGLPLLGWGLLRWLYVFLGLMLAWPRGRGAYWGYAGFMALALWLNGIDTTFFGVVLHAVLLPNQERLRTLLGLGIAVIVTTIGLYVKTIIGLPCAMLFGVACLQRYVPNRQWLPLLASAAAIPITMVLGWLLFFGNLDGFGTMLLGTFWLTVGNSAAVCHYPPNDWWLLGLAIACWFYWPFATAQRRVWWWLLLPVFAFWKYGFSRQDIWHLETTFKVLVLAAGPLLLLLDVRRWYHFALMGGVLIGFFLNLRHSEGWNPPEWHGTGWRNGLDWLQDFTEKKQRYAEQYRQNVQKSHALPDSVRQIIGNGTVDVFPWHYTYAAANGLRLSPRHIPQSYAAYHPWLDGLDARFFASEQAPDFVIWHLKPYEEGGQFMGLDDRYILQDAPKTMLALLDRYAVRVRHPRFLVLEKRAAHFVAGQWTQMPYATFLEKGIEGNKLVYLKGKFKKTALGRLKSMLYKDDPIFLDVDCGGVVRRIKIVPALAAQGIWLAPWLERPCLPNEPYRLPRLQWHIPDTWEADFGQFTVQTTDVDPASGWMPLEMPNPALETRQIVLDGKNAEVQPKGFSAGHEETIEALPSGGIEYVVRTRIKARHNTGCCQLVLSINDATGKQVQYAQSEYCPMGVGDGQFWPISLRSEVPNGVVAPLRVKIYVWNTTTGTIIVAPSE
jgi:hypothetical protein